MSKTKATTIETSTIDTPALPSQILSIGTTNASSIEINGGISAPTASDVVSLFSSTTTGDIGLGSAQTGGILNLGTGASRTSSINIGSLTNTGNISIETASVLNTNASPAIGIGTSSSNKTIKINNNTSSVHCSSIDLNGSTINNITGTSGAVSIGSAQTGGTLNLGTNTARTGTISIGALTGTSTNTISIGTATTGAIGIGSVNNLTTVGTLTVSNPIRLPSSYASGLVATNLGYTISINPGSTVPAGSGSAQLAYTVTNVGFYLFTFCLNGTFTTAPTNFYFTMSGANANAAKSYVTISGTNWSCSSSQYVSTTASTYNLIINYTGGVGLALITTQSYLQFIRIA